MPALELFGHKTFVAGDDLRIPSCIAILLRLLQIALAAPLLARFQQIEWANKNELLEVEDEEDQASSSRTQCSGRTWMGDKERAVFYSYWVLTIMSALLAIVLDGYILHVSSQGAPVESYKRSRLQPLCFLKWIPFSLFRAACLALSILTLSSFESVCECLMSSSPAAADAGTRGSNEIWSAVPRDGHKCPRYTSTYSLLGLLFMTHFVDAIVSGLFYLYFLSAWSHRRTKKYQRISSRILSCNWALCCRLTCTCTSLLTCCLLGGTRAILADFSDISAGLEALMDDNENPVDVTVTDILAGILVLRLVQAHARKMHSESVSQRLREQNSNENIQQEDEETANDTNEASASRRRRLLQYFSILHVHRREDDVENQDQQQSKPKGDVYCEEIERELLSPYNKEHQALLADGAHYMRLADAVYGHLMDIYHHPVSAPCCLTLDRIRCRGASSACIRWKTNFFAVSGDNFCGCNEIGLRRVADFERNDQELVYASFRVGVMATPYVVVLDHAKQCVVVVVRGTLSLEDAVADLTISPRLLPETFGYADAYCHSGILGCSEWIYEDLRRTNVLGKLLSNGDTTYSGYKLRIAGHSLGAGCAALLSLMFLKEFPELKCYCFEPPGAVLSENVADQDYIISFVVDADVVPRLSYPAVRDLRDSILDTIARIKVPKHEIMNLSLTNNTDELLATQSSQIIHSRQSQPESKFSKQVKAMKDYQSGRVPSGYVDVNLCPPGRIVYLVPTNSALSSYSRKINNGYWAVWANRDDLREIQITKTLISDHDPNKVRNELENLRDWFQNQESISCTFNEKVITSRSIYRGEG